MWYNLKILRNFELGVISMFCEQCGSFIQDGEVFCTNCGAKATPADIAVQPAPAPAPGPVVQPIIQTPAQPVQPVYQQPVYQQPTYQQPANTQPIQPVYQQPAYIAQPVVITPFEKKSGNSMATVGMIFGIITVATYWLTILNLGPGIIAIIFSIIGLTKKNASGKGRAIAGLITAGVGIALGILVLVAAMADSNY